MNARDLDDVIHRLADIMKRQKPLPSIEMCLTGPSDCRAPGGQSYCHEPVVYRVWWGAGQHGNSPAHRDLCAAHGARWAKKRGLDLPLPV